MIGANFVNNSRCEFKVWAPLVKNISLKILSPHEQLIPMKKDDRGYWNVVINELMQDAEYLYEIDGSRDRPDPASYSQPYGVHKASQVVNHNAFKWEDANWTGVSLSQMIMYEIHVGTFSPEGTFEAVIPRLDSLVDTGINAIELMPVAQFPGGRNWGYDGVYPFAVQNTYGGTEGLKRLVNECHRKGIAVILDVVYNHLGPEGNYLWDFGPYFTESYKTPWGQALNFDGPFSNEVRRYFIDNAVYWLEQFHIDALRLDAIHGICDMSAKHFLVELAEEVDRFSEEMGREYYLIAESDLNDSKVARDRDGGGFGIDALWCDDFHHALHTLITGETNGYYRDFGKTEHLMKSLSEGYVYSGQFSEFRNKNHGNSSKLLSADRFVVFSQNHDQVGNRSGGERMAGLVSFDLQKVAAAAVVLSPYIPLIFMGEEYGERTPFLYFVSHSDEHLVEGIREGRKREFASFGWNEEPHDPLSLDTYMGSKVEWAMRYKGRHLVMHDYFKYIISLRKSIPVLSEPDKRKIEVSEVSDKVMVIRRWIKGSSVLLLYNFNDKNIRCDIDCADMEWKIVLDSSDRKWEGPGSILPGHISGKYNLEIVAESCALYVNAV